jgi:hypothetical protein
VFSCFSLLGHEGLEVANPKGGQNDVEVVAIKSRLKHFFTMKQAQTTYIC